MIRRTYDIATLNRRGITVKCTYDNRQLVISIETAITQQTANPLDAIADIHTVLEMAEQRPKRPAPRQTSTKPQPKKSDQ